MIDNTRLRHLFLISLLVTPSASRLAAEAPTESWSIRVAALDIVGADDVLWLRTGSGKEPVEVPLNTRTFSQPIDYRGPARLVFHQNEDDAAAEEPPSPLATADLKSKSSLLVFAPGQDNKTYAAFVVSDEEFPFGSFRLINFSRVMVRAEFDGKPVLLKPGASETLAFREAATDIPVRILARADDSTPRLIRQSSWSIVPSQRELVLFFPNPANGFVRLRHFVDSKAEPGPD